MKKFNTKVSWILGYFITKLKQLSFFSRVTRHVRLRYPKVWGAVIRRIKPLYWTYQVSRHDESNDSFFKDMPVFNEQQWQKELLRKREHSATLITNGIMNHRPIVKPSDILDRINRATALHKH